MHRTLDLSFPEFTRHVRDVTSAKATTLLLVCPTGLDFAVADPHALAELKYDSRHVVGLELAQALCDAAKRTVGRHHSTPYELQMRYACEDITTLRARIKKLDDDIKATLERHEVGKLLTTIDGIGDNTAARLIASIDFANFASASALAAYVGVAPLVNHSGKRQPLRGPACTMGDAALRAKLWMPAPRSAAQPVAQGFLRPSRGGREAEEGRDHRVDAKAPRSHHERGAHEDALRAASRRERLRDRALEAGVGRGRSVGRSSRPPRPPEWLSEAKSGGGRPARPDRAEPAPRTRRPLDCASAHHVVVSSLLDVTVSLRASVTCTDSIGRHIETILRCPRVVCARQQSLPRTQARCGLWLVWRRRPT
ncbi:MAG: IS110 family transposase [Sandaracinus sp.]|nr:IS110 family transposase [Sandaracinus sp.]